MTRGHRDDGIATERLTPGPSLIEEIQSRAAMIRRETIRLIGVAKSCHYTSVYSAILATHYSGVMRIGEDPDWPERDRLILSKGHVAVGVYPLLPERSYIAAGLLDEYTRFGNPLRRSSRHALGTGGLS